MQKITQRIRSILSAYESDSPGTKANLARILMHGKLAGTGRLVILPVDQGFEHGPARSFAVNPLAYDPHYTIELAIDAGLSAYAAPLGMIEAVANTHAGAIPLILKLNSSNSLEATQKEPDQAVTGSVEDALRLGCSAVGFTVYPGSENYMEMLEELQGIAAQAKYYGLAVVVWSYPRGKDMAKVNETAVDVISYAVHMAAIAGAHIIKVKPPTSAIGTSHAKAIYNTIPHDTLSDRVRDVMLSAFNGKRLVVFSGGESKDADSVLEEVKAIRDGGGNGSIIGRNTFQRPRKEALELLEQVLKIYS